MLPMTRFEMRPSDIGSSYTANLFLSVQSLFVLTENLLSSGFRSNS